MRLRFHCQTAAASLTKPQYQINVVRTGAAGALGGARRRAEPAHQRHGRGVRDPDRGGDEDRAAHAADHRRRNRRRQRRRSARRLVFRREPDDATTSSAIFEMLDEVDAQRRHDQADRGGLVPAAASPTSPTTPRCARQNGDKPVIGVNRYVEQRREVRHRAASIRSADGRAPDRSRLQRVRRERDNAKVQRAARRSSSRSRRTSTQNIMPITIELVARGRHDGRHRREAEDAVGHVPREPGILTTVAEWVARFVAARGPSARVRLAGWPHPADLGSPRRERRSRSSTCGTKAPRSTWRPPMRC